MPRIIRTEKGDPLETGTFQGVTPVALMTGLIPLTQGLSAPFFVVEIDAFKSTYISPAWPTAWNVVPWNALTTTAPVTGTTTTIRASDFGYRTRASDPGGVVAYPPLLVGSIQIDREIPIDPAQTSSGGSWGEITLINDAASNLEAYTALNISRDANGNPVLTGGHQGITPTAVKLDELMARQVTPTTARFDEIFRSMNIAGRAVRIYRGAKTLDDTRGIWIDPPYGDLVPVFIGIAESWFLDEDNLRIRLRSASYWLERPYQQQTYSGAGLYQGASAVANKKIPRVRGGSDANPVQNVTPSRIASVRPIFQVSDGPGKAVNVYEGAKKVFTDDGDVGNLFDHAPPLSGHVQRDDAQTAFESGAEPFKALTVDVRGSFPVAGAVTNPALIAKFMILEDMGLSAAYMDVTSFDNTAAAYPYTAGVFFGPDDNVDALTAVSRVLAGPCFKLIDSRVGTLRCFPFRKLTGAETPVLTITMGNCISVVPLSNALPTTLDPPPWRIRVGWNKNYTTLNDSAIYDTADNDRKLFVAAPSEYAGFVNASVAIAYERPSDLDPFGGSLLIKAEAEEVAASIGTFLTSRLQAFEVTLPLSVGVSLDLGDVVRIVWPFGGLRTGKLARIIREQFRSDDDAIILTALVNGD